MTEEEVAEAAEAILEALANAGTDSPATLGPSAFCTSYTDNGKRQIYLTGVFPVDMAGWRNVKEDRPSTEREVMRVFEIEYSAWLQPRYKGVWLQQTHCRLFGFGADAAERRTQDIEDFRELGHRVVETDWRPARL